MFRDLIDVKVNVRIEARDDRGKRVKSMCRQGHNIWTNLGRQYLAEVVSPTSGGAHYNDSPVRVIRYMAAGIGGDSQMSNVDLTFPTLAAHYPGQNIFDDTSLLIQTLERPVKITGAAGDGLAPGVWLGAVVAPPTFGPPPDPGPPPVVYPITKVEFSHLFGYTDINLGGAYPSVPLSEMALVLSNETPDLLSEEVYDYLDTPACIASTRQKLVAYNTFDPISKTMSVALEVFWELQF